MRVRLTSLVCLLAVGSAHGADVPCPRLAAAPTIDGDLADWAGAAPLAMTDAANVDDLKVDKACLSWDDANLYVAMRMLDHHLVNKEASIGDGDCAELRVVLPDGDTIRLILAPTSAGGTPAMSLLRIAPNRGPKTDLAAGTDPKVEVKGVRWAVKTDKESWTVEAAIPAALIGAKLVEGAGFPFIVIGWDRDNPDVDEWKQWKRRSESANSKKPDTWPKLVLGK